MPSPFPGMDPYLEDPSVFPDLHDSLIAGLREALNAGLPEPYYAGIGSRVWVESARRRIGPDVQVLRPPETNGGARTEGGGVAVAVAAEPVLVYVPDEEVRETFVEIHLGDNGDRLVTLIEILSPANKTPGEMGRDQYLRKQQEVLTSQVHLVEIDLLRVGTHSTAVPRDHAVARTGGFDYHVCIHRFDQHKHYTVYPIRLPQPLPAIAVPLLPGDGEANVNLQAVFDRCYETGQYRRRVRYREWTPTPAL